MQVHVQDKRSWWLWLFFLLLLRLLFFLLLCFFFLLLLWRSLCLSLFLPNTNEKQSVGIKIKCSSKKAKTQRYQKPHLFSFFTHFYELRMNERYKTQVVQNGRRKGEEGRGCNNEKRVVLYVDSESIMDGRWGILAK